ncbi:MAG: hypothetical protein GY940_08580, partial [bacterium]|nr:hypothetical protein [bacterium]
GDIVLFTFHHIVFDGISALIFVDSLWKTYFSYCRGLEPEPGTAGNSYRELVTWEREMKAGEEGAAHLEYWKKQLAGEPAVLSLTTDYDRPPVRGFNGATCEASLEPGLSRKIRAAAKSLQVNLAVFFQAVFKVLLYRYTGQRDIIVGMPTMGRPQQRFEGVIGYFINMIPIRGSLSGEKSAAELLQELRYTVVDGLDHAAYPFPALVRELGIHREQTFSPLFRVSYAYQNFIQAVDKTDTGFSSQPGLRIEVIP